MLLTSWTNLLRLWTRPTAKIPASHTNATRCMSELPSATAGRYRSASICATDLGSVVSTEACSSHRQGSRPSETCARLTHEHDAATRDVSLNDPTLRAVRVLHEIEFGLA